jgi:arabinofuranosyltransferase
VTDQSEVALTGPARARRWIALGGCAALLAHASAYRFVCDDAFISFRYARNLAEGFGLVFNPGDAPVEGYTNFLWVLLLAAGASAGIAAETLAPLLSLAASAALAWIVARFACGETLATNPEGRWVAALVPPLLLAATRSVAVWSASGLETRLFELLVVSGLLRLRCEVRSERAAQPVSALLFAAACWTRPDGALIAGACFAAGFALAPRGARNAVLAAALLCATGVVAQLGFRFAYYGEWLPNTFYAKVGGRLWPSMGLAYAEAFALEYALWLWLPLAAAGARARWRAGDRLLPALAATAVLPHAAYVIAIGGDHFEFRPFDLYFPLLCLLVGDGLGALCARGANAARAACAVGLMGVALHVELPLRTHVGFPERYVSGFPGAREGSATRDYLRPERGWLTSLPGLRALASRHRERLFELTRHFVGIRAEEHALFADDARREGLALARLIELGVLPSRAHIATDSVGAIPYFSRLRTLDRLGLTDAVVARSDFVRPELLGHGKTASLDYARAIGVDLWPVDPVHLLWLPFDPSLPERLRPWREAGLDVHFAAVGGGLYLVAHLPQGIDATREKFPELAWRSAFAPEARELIRHE